jgi:hypothetical protein
MTMPGLRSLTFARRWFDAGTVSRVFEPLVADWQREWNDAGPRRRSWVSVRARLAFATAVIVCLPQSVATPTPVAVTRRVLGHLLVSTCACATLLALPLLWEIDPLWLRGGLFVFALPASIALAFPFAVAAGVDALRCHEALPPHRARVAALKLAVAGCLVMFVSIGWVTPASNQQWRATMAGDRPPPPNGIRELTIVELVAYPSRAKAHEPSSGRVGIQRELNNRLSLILLPAAMVWLRSQILDMPRRRFSPPPLGVVTVACLMGFVLLRWSDRPFERALLLPPGAGAWLPLLAMLLLGVAMPWWTRHRQSA